MRAKRSTCEKRGDAETETDKTEKTKQKGSRQAGGSSSCLHSTHQRQQCGCLLGMHLLQSSHHMLVVCTMQSLLVVQHIACLTVHRDGLGAQYWWWWSWCTVAAALVEHKCCSRLGQRIAGMKKHLVHVGRAYWGRSLFQRSRPPLVQGPSTGRTRARACPATRRWPCPRTAPPAAGTSGDAAAAWWEGSQTAEAQSFVRY